MFYTASQLFLRVVARLSLMRLKCRICIFYIQISLIMYAWGLKGIHPLEILMGREPGMESVIYIVPLLASSRRFSSTFPRSQMSQVTSQLPSPISTSPEMQSLYAPPCCRGHLRWTAVLTKMSEAVKRLRKNTTRLKSRCRPPVNHISTIADHRLWRLTRSPLFTVTDHLPMIWWALMGNHHVCDWRRQWTTSSRWGDSAHRPSCVSEVEQHWQMKQFHFGGRILCMFCMFLSIHKKQAIT